MSAPARKVSPFAHGLLLTAVVTWFYALVVGISAATGQRFILVARGNHDGPPLPATWPHAALFVAVGAALWLAGRRWDAPGFVALRGRRPWLVPAIGGLVIAPASVMLIFLLVR